MSRNVAYLERFEYVCRECAKKGAIQDVLINPEVLLIRGYCPACRKHGAYKVIDIEALRAEHDAIAQEELTSGSAISRKEPGRRLSKTKEKAERAEAASAHAKHAAEIAWKWELVQDLQKQEKDKDDSSGTQQE